MLRKQTYSSEDPSIHQHTYDAKDILVYYVGSVYTTSWLLLVRNKIISYNRTNKYKFKRVFNLLQNSMIVSWWDNIFYKVNNSSASNKCSRKREPLQRNWVLRAWYWCENSVIKLMPIVLSPSLDRLISKATGSFVSGISLA